MWFSKDAITFTATFYKTGEAEFEFYSLDDINEFLYVWFSIDVFCRIHASSRLSSVFYFNHVLSKFVDDAEAIDFNEAVQLMNHVENDSFLISSSIMKNNKEQIRFKLKVYNFNKPPMMVKAYFQYNGLEKNMSFAFARLMKSLNQRLSDSAKELLVACLSDLAVNEDFLDRKYSFMNYTDIPRRIFEEKASKLI